jgi:hypothetical protein
MLARREFDFIAEIDLVEDGFDIVISVGALAEDL